MPHNEQDSSTSRMRREQTHTETEKGLASIPRTAIDFMRMEGLIAAVGIFLCWFVGIFVYDEDMSLTRYAIIGILTMLALYFLVRFVHWAWDTPIPFLHSCLIAVVAQHHLVLDDAKQ